MPHEGERPRAAQGQRGVAALLTQADGDFEEGYDEARKAEHNDDDPYHIDQQPAGQTEQVAAVGHPDRLEERDARIVVVGRG